VISSRDATREFAAKPTGKPGVYRATVVFPSAGRWDLQVLDGFNDALPHSFPAVQIADTPATAPPGSVRRRRDRVRLALGRGCGAGARAGAARRRRAERRPARATRGAEPA
jgi:hypothetical protein